MINEIEIKYKELINKAKEYMKEINDYEHGISHMQGVVDYTYELLDKLKVDVNKEVCVISAYWHDVGRIKCDEGHEKVSAEMLKEEMEKQGYDNELINECYLAIVNHKWDMIPTTIEGHVVRDADKLDWLGRDRWEICLKNNTSMDSIIKILPYLKSKILHFEESKEIYDRDIVNLVEILYTYISN